MVTRSPRSCSHLGSPPPSRRPWPHFSRRSQTAPRSRPAAWLTVPPWANARAEPGNRTLCPDRRRSSGVGQMNQITFDLGDERMNRFAMAVSEQPQQRLENFGVGAVSDTELLAMMMQGNGTRAEEAVSLATKLLAEAGSIGALLSWPPADYRRIKGIGQVKRLQLGAIAEIARRMMTVRQDAPPLF